MNFITSSFSQSDLTLVKRVSRELNVLETELNMVFQEREWLIRQILLCLINGRNIIVYGDPGTAKTMIGDAIFEAIQGPGQKGEIKQVFKIQLDMFTTLDDVVGATNVKLLTEKGDFERKIEGFMPTAHYVGLDEFFEGLSIARALNDMMNEKELREGVKVVKVPLLTAIATTNRKPQDISALFPQLSLDSVNDRFLCVSEVGNVVDDEKLDEMLANYVMGIKPIATVDFADMQKIVALINGTNQVPNTDYLKVFRKALRAYETKVSKKNGVVLPSRRWTWLTQVVEANALLDGRIQLHFDDILATVYALAPDKESEQYKIFMEVVPPILEKAKIEFKENVDEVQRNLLDMIESELKTINQRVSDPTWIQNATPSVIGSTMTQLIKIQGKLESVKPELASNATLKDQLLKGQQKILKNVQDSIK